MIDNVLLTTLPLIPWMAEVPDTSGVLVFDRNGALLGGGCIQKTADNRAEVGSRWALGTIDYDWAERFQLEEPNLLCEIVSQGVVIMLQATMVEVGKIWTENESKWVGRMEGVLASLDRLGVRHETQEQPREPNGKSDFVTPRG